MPCPQALAIDVKGHYHAGAKHGEDTATVTDNRRGGVSRSASIFWREHVFVLAQAVLGRLPFLLQSFQIR